MNKVDQPHLSYEIHKLCAFQFSQSTSSKSNGIEEDACTVRVTQLNCCPIYRNVPRLCFKLCILCDVTHMHCHTYAMSHICNVREGSSED